MLRALRLVVLLAAAAAASGCSMFGEEEDITKSWSAQRLYDAAKEALVNGDFDTSVDYYEKLESRYPFGPLAEQAQLDIAYAYYKNDEPASAIAAADRFIKLHPRHANVDYAYYLKGLVHFTRGQGFIDRIIPKDMSQRDPGSAVESFRSFEELVTGYPESRYAKDARQRMLYLKNILAQHEVHVANYYMRREAYLAAANRARYVVENYQRTPAVPEALVIMAKAYKIMELEDLSADALRVLKLNYPEDPRIAEIEALTQR